MRRFLSELSNKSKEFAKEGSGDDLELRQRVEALLKANRWLAFNLPTGVSFALYQILLRSSRQSSRPTRTS